MSSAKVVITRTGSWKHTYAYDGHDTYTMRNVSYSEGAVGGCLSCSFEINTKCFDVDLVVTDRIDIYDNAGVKRWTGFPQSYSGTPDHWTMVTGAGYWERLRTIPISAWGLSIQYVGAEATCTLTINNGVLTTTAGGSPGLTLDLRAPSYYYIENLVAQIDGDADYTAVKLLEDNKVRSLNLLDVQAVDIKTAVMRFKVIGHKRVYTAFTDMSDAVKDIIQYDIEDYSEVLYDAAKVQASSFNPYTTGTTEKWRDSWCAFEIPASGFVDPEYLSPSVVYYNGTYYIYYVLIDFDTQVGEVYLRTTIDWVDYTTAVKVVAIGDEGTYDTFSIVACAAIHDGSNFVLWYQADGGVNGYGIIKCDSAAGTIFANHARVIDDSALTGNYHVAKVGNGIEEQSQLCVIRESASAYKIWFVGEDSVTYAYAILYADSVDGDTWANYAVAIQPGDEGTWDTDTVNGMSVLRNTSGNYIGCYVSHDNSGVADAVIECISTDGVTWTGHRVTEMNQVAVGMHLGGCCLYQEDLLYSIPSYTNAGGRKVGLYIYEGYNPLMLDTDAATALEQIATVVSAIAEWRYGVDADREVYFRAAPSTAGSRLDLAKCETWSYQKYVGAVRTLGVLRGTPKEMQAANTFQAMDTTAYAAYGMRAVVVDSAIIGMQASGKNLVSMMLAISNIPKEQITALIKTTSHFDISTLVRVVDKNNANHDVEIEAATYSLDDGRVSLTLGIRQGDDLYKALRRLENRVTAVQGGIF